MVYLGLRALYALSELSSRATTAVRTVVVSIAHVPITVDALLYAPWVLPVYVAVLLFFFFFLSSGGWGKIKL